MPSMVQIAVGAAMTSLSDPADDGAGLAVWVGVTEVADVIVGSAPFSKDSPSPRSCSFSGLPVCNQVWGHPVLRQYPSNGRGICRCRARAPGGPRLGRRA